MNPAGSPGASTAARPTRRPVTKQIVATLQDENGGKVESEKMLEIDFANGKPTRAGDQFGIGLVK